MTDETPIAEIALPQAGGCQCGKIRYEIAAPPRFAYACHCMECQRATSSAFSVAIVVPENSFSLSGIEPRSSERAASGGGGTVTRWFCPECGTWICGGENPTAPSSSELRWVQAGTLDDTSWVRPTSHFWVRSKQPWIALPDDDQAFDTQPS